jgi:hypothetical protein
LSHRMSQVATPGKNRFYFARHALGCTFCEKERFYCWPQGPMRRPQGRTGLGCLDVVGSAGAGRLSSGACPPFDLGLLGLRRGPGNPWPIVLGVIVLVLLSASIAWFTPVHVEGLPCGSAIEQITESRSIRAGTGRDSECDAAAWRRLLLLAVVSGLVVVGGGVWAGIRPRQVGPSSPV